MKLLIKFSKKICDKIVLFVHPSLCPLAAQTDVRVDMNCQNQVSEPNYAHSCTFVILSQ
jgi:hypothetical protein